MYDLNPYLFHVNRKISIIDNANIYSKCIIFNKYTVRNWRYSTMLCKGIPDDRVLVPLERYHAL